MRVEEQYEDVLQNIEFVIVSTYRAHPELSDYGVMSALEALLDVWAAEKVGRKPRDFRLSDIERELMEDMQATCEWRLCRRPTPLYADSESPIPQDQALTVDEIVLCLKRLLKSVKRWNKVGGTRGYFNFIKHFIM